MRVAVLSDIHANLHALEAVAHDAQKGGVDQFWCLGDVVGYGANPRETLRWVREHATVVVKGNHDHAIATGDVTGFNPMAASSARAHAHMLTPPERSEIFAWPEQARRDMGDDQEALLVHGSPDDPLHEYVQPHDARLGLARWSGRAALVLLGHTHRPFIAQRSPARVPFRADGFHEDLRETSTKTLTIVNPGSVGQPRDGDPRASYALLDTERNTLTLRRVVYDVEAAAQAILKSGLDQMLALRLYEGR